MTRSENLAVGAIIAHWAQVVERDRHEPDKLLCHVASMRRLALDYRMDAETTALEEGERP